jgi:hypothetical protein
MNSPLDAKPVAVMLRRPGASRGGGNVAKGFWGGGGRDAQYGGVKESDLPNSPTRCVLIFCFLSLSCLSLTLFCVHSSLLATSSVRVVTAGVVVRRWFERRCQPCFAFDPGEFF